MRNIINLRQQKAYRKAGWTLEPSTTVRYQQLFQPDIIYLAFGCYIHHQFFIRHLFRAGLYKIPALRQARWIAVILKQRH